VHRFATLPPDALSIRASIRLLRPSIRRSAATQGAEPTQDARVLNVGAGVVCALVVRATRGLDARCFDTSFDMLLRPSIRRSTATQGKQLLKDYPSTGSGRRSACAVALRGAQHRSPLQGGARYCPLGVGVKSGRVPRRTGSPALQCGKPAEAGYGPSFQHVCLTQRRLNRTLSRAERSAARIEGRGSREKGGCSGLLLSFDTSPRRSIRLLRPSIRPSIRLLRPSIRPSICCCALRYAAPRLLRASSYSGLLRVQSLLRMRGSRCVGRPLP
jgi:hypothetical protein